MSETPVADLRGCASAWNPASWLRGISKSSLKHLLQPTAARRDMIVYMILTRS